ncbi:hypothetical protein RIF29_11358 [Crotalaria pallida]|uniref:RING-type E3 ubiquitin transferase n=1 Tax=Crotalaria pallida TaxID=3830 RepID=A0AAN9P0Q3_CROPI
MAFLYSLDMAPTPLDETDMELYRSLAQVHDVGDFFNIKLTLARLQQQPDQTITPRLEFLRNSTMLLQYPQFLEHGLSYIGSHFPPSVVPRELLLLQIMPRVIAYVQGLRFMSDLRGESGRCRFFNLDLEFVVIRRVYEDVAVVITEEESPTKIAFESIKKVILEEGMEMERCSVCLEEFVGGTEVSSLPCKHVYHGECITRWLQRSHTCPLCRYSMANMATVDQRSE